MAFGLKTVRKSWLVSPCGIRYCLNDLFVKYSSRAFPGAKFEYDQLFKNALHAQASYVVLRLPSPPALLYLFKLQ